MMIVIFIYFVDVTHENETEKEIFVREREKIMRERKKKNHVAR